MDINKVTYQILGQKLLSEFDSKEYVKWAIKVAKEGYDSESLWILAGLDNESTEVREEYFWKAIKELNLEIEREEIELLNDYAIYLSKAVLNNALSPRTGVKKMFDLCRESGYDEKYIQFYELDEDLDCLKYGDITPIFNHNITEENANEIILKEFKLFLECEKFGVTKDIYESAYCNKCKQVSKPKLVTKYQFRKPRKYLQWTCGNCRSKEIDSFKSQIGKEKILEKMKNHT